MPDDLRACQHCRGSGLMTVGGWPTRKQCCGCPCGVSLYRDLQQSQAEIARGEYYTAGEMLNATLEGREPRLGH